MGELVFTMELKGRNERRGVLGSLRERDGYTGDESAVEIMGMRNRYYEIVNHRISMFLSVGHHACERGLSNHGVVCSTGFRTPGSDPEGSEM